MFYQPRQRRTAQVNMAPMIDMVFLLLIFFMVATVFPDNDGVEIEKPKADSARPLRSDQLLVAVDREGAFWREGSVYTPDEIELLLRTGVAANPDVTLVIKADRRAATGALVRLMDVARLAGVSRMGLAADPAEAGETP